MSRLHRELPSCWNCGSTMRFRAIVHLLSEELLGAELLLPDFPKRPWRGVGLSDWEGYARPLAEKWQYTNTFYHCEPFLDITTIPPKMEGTLDFLIASDVFEHIAPPITVAFENARRLLKPGGLFILTVPYVREGRTQEHFPELFRYEIVEREGRPILNNITRDGRHQQFDELVFHGGEGVNLELRMFSEGDILDTLTAVGFTDIRIHHEPCYRHGIIWLEDRHLPFTARVPL
ncbi:MAG: class I SAM-dependent methyltransferase [Anaerolineae bacterium]|nr:class I SAM-dependent methyltransferase [Anaerolineae bacterium]